MNRAGAPTSSPVSRRPRSRLSASDRGRGLRRGLFGGLAAMIATTVLAIGAAPALAAPWQCDAYGYLFQAVDGVTYEIVQVDLATGEQRLIGSTPSATNAVGYNVLDDFFYGMRRLSAVGDPERWGLVRIHDDGSVDDLPLPTGPGGTVDENVAYPIGEVDENGHYWLKTGPTWYEIDLTTPTPTVLRSGSATPPLPVLQPGNDWSWIDGALYSVGQSAGAAQTYLLRFTPTGGYENLGEIPLPGAGIGATFTDASGYLYASQNATNDVYRVDPRTLQTIRASVGRAPAPGNDGARCADAVIPTITVRKTVDGRVRAADQFTVGLVEDTGRALDSATTSGAGTTASTTNWPVSQGRTYTITDAMAPGSASPLGEYVQSIVCTDANGRVVATGGGAPSWTLLAGEATFYTCTVTNRSSSDLALEKSASPSPVVPGRAVTYRVTVRNDGPSTATNVRVVDRLPEGVSFASADAGCTQADGTVTCTSASLAPGASQTFTIVTRAASSLEHCPLNTATVSSDVADPNPANNVAEACPPLRGEVDLSIRKTASQPQVTPGGQVMYTLVVRNHGPSDDAGVRVVDPMAPGLSLQLADPSQGSCTTTGNRLACNLGRLVAGGSAQVLVTAQAPTTLGDVTNTSVVSGDREETNPRNNQDSATISVVPGPLAQFDLEVTKTASVRRPVIGQSVRYRVVVVNRGPQAAPNASVVDTLNVPGTVVSVRSTQGRCTRRLPMDCELGTIAAGSRVTITVVVKHREIGCNQRNAASAVADGTDVAPASNLDVTRLCVRAVPLTIRKVAGRGTVRAGESLTYTIRVSNRSRGEARRVRVCDRLPAGLVFVSARPRARLSGGQRCWTIRRLGARGSRTFRVTVRALPGASGRLTNRATARSPDARATARASRAVRVVAGDVAAGGVTG
jgi:uncharacterized repeat protein (TIGR01451 family)